MAFVVDGVSAPNIANSSVARIREYLTGKEVDDLMAAARKSSRYGHRDATMDPDRLPPRTACLRGLRSPVASG
jgi:hypothetical protein